MNSAFPSSANDTKPALAPKAQRPALATIHRERSLHRYEFSPVRHSTHNTIAAIGLLWVSAAASSARAATNDPEFHFNLEDATAVAAYPKSLNRSNVNR